MRIFEVITPLKPKTPEQQRINALKQQKDRASDALNTERERQKKTKAVKKLAQARQSLSALNLS